MFTIWFTFPKNLVMHIVDIWQYPASWFKYLQKDEYYSAGEAWGKMIMTLLD